MHMCRVSFLNVTKTHPMRSTLQESVITLGCSHALAVQHFLFFPVSVCSYVSSCCQSDDRE